MFRVKICGVRTVENALEVAAAGADAIGLNFYRPSKRYVAPETAAEIVAALPVDVAKVGVFVNASADEVEAIARQVRLDYVQLHGDESPETAADLAGRGLRVIRAVRCSTATLAAPLAWLRAARESGVRLTAVLVDAEHAGEFGGTGRRADARVVAELRRAEPNLPVILAGGLTPENVAEAIRSARPDGVDTASGVESAPGVKCPTRSARFASAARAELI